jgi:hypothetical protein
MRPQSRPHHGLDHLVTAQGLIHERLEAAAVVKAQKAVGGRDHDHGSQPDLCFISVWIGTADRSPKQLIGLMSMSDLTMAASKSN